MQYHENLNFELEDQGGMRRRHQSSEGRRKFTIQLDSQLFRTDRRDLEH
jgi:hypothetical protein